MKPAAEEDDDPRVMEVEDVSPDAERDVEVIPDEAEEPTVAEAPSAGMGSPSPTTSLWSASESAASIAPEPWRPAEPASWEPSHPTGSSDESSHEQASLIDLTATDQTSIDELDEDEADEDGGADSGSTIGGGLAAQNEKIWQLLRGRRRD